MLFAILTLLTALALAAVAGWFSIVGFMAIYAGAPMYALVMGVVTEAAKLVTTSWLYRNWSYSNWKLKSLLTYFTVTLMIVTSIGVFGFLSKAHVEQSAGTLDHASKIETLNYQIQREKSIIADNEKVINQLDTTVNSFLGKDDKLERSLTVRKSQAPQRKQLREDSAAAQKRIDTISAEKFKLESEVRKVELDVGPIRYIAELFYGVEENATKNIEAAVRIFTLLIVSSLDPLAVILLIAANHTLIRIRNEKEEKISTQGSDRQAGHGTSHTDEENSIKTQQGLDPVTTLDIAGPGEHIEAPLEKNAETSIPEKILPTSLGLLDEEKEITAPKINKVSESEESPATTSVEVVNTQQGLQNSTDSPELGQGDASPTDSKSTMPEEVMSREDILRALNDISIIKPTSSSQVNQPRPTMIHHDPEPEIERSIIVPGEPKEPWAQEASTLREILGVRPHFVPQKVSEISSSKAEDQKEPVILKKNNKYPEALGWITEFKGPHNG